jgi:signal transduction histidine kinase
VRELVEEAMHEARALTFDLSPPILYELGLWPAIEWLCERMQQEHGLRLEMRGTAALPGVPEELGVLLFQSVRELLLNVARHAGTDRARVLLEADEEEVRITVADHGRGFESAEQSAPRRERGRFGLFSVQERLNHWGGRLELDSAPGEGTRATLVAPVCAADPEAEGSAS